MPEYKKALPNIIMSDYPDPDVIRVDDCYYMVSTTMHFMPGCVILRSYNLIDWEFASYVYDELEPTERQTLKDNRGVYGKGMWAASLNYHQGKFYVSFVANDTQKTYLYTADKITGPWTKANIQGFYHDMSLFWDDDGRVYTVCGNTEIHLIELKSDLSGPKEGGVNKIIIQSDREKCALGYEGSHLYKINGRYYNFMIYIPKGKMRTQACYMADQLEGPWTGGDVLCSDLGGWNSGVAQGGIVQDKEGKWFGILFQDHGALGRIPVLVSVSFGADGMPVFADVAGGTTVIDNKPGYQYAPLWSNDFTNPAWQWNHIPDKAACSVEPSRYQLQTTKTVVNITQAANTYTQRTLGEKCAASVTLDASAINEGDFAGLAALEGEYGFIAVTRQNGKLYLVGAEHKISYTPWSMGVFDTDAPDIKTQLPLENAVVELGLEFDLTKPEQKVRLMYKKSGFGSDFVQLGEPVQLRYTLDQFVGVRFALFCYSTQKAGGRAVFTDFNYLSNSNKL